MAKSTPLGNFRPYLEGQLQLFQLGIVVTARYCSGGGGKHRYGIEAVVASCGHVGGWRQGQGIAVALPGESVAGPCCGEEGRVVSTT